MLLLFVVIFVVVVVVIAVVVGVVVVVTRIFRVFENRQNHYYLVRLTVPS